MNEQELKEKLHCSLTANSEINDLCEQLQEQDAQFIPLANELIEANNKLQTLVARLRTKISEQEVKLQHVVMLPLELIKKAKESIKQSEKLFQKLSSADYCYDFPTHYAEELKDRTTPNETLPNGYG